MSEFGFDPDKMIAGFCGALVYAFFDRQTHPVLIAGSLVTGICTANFLGEASFHIVGSYVGTGGSYFIAGLCGMVLVPIIINAAKRWGATWGPNNPGKSGADQ